MSRCLSATVRRGVLVAVAGVLLTAAMTVAGSAQMRMKDKIVDSVANTLVNSIQNDSCAQFAATLKQHKSGGSSGSKASGMMKNDPAARQRFVNKVAGPLLNKMIDCDLLPGH